MIADVSTSVFTPVWSSRRWQAAALLLWLGCTAIYFLSAPGRIDMFDGGIRHDVTESIVETGVPAVRDPTLPGVLGRGGLRYAWYELGSSVTAIPFVLLGKYLGHGSLEARQFGFAMTSVPFASGVIALLFLIYGRLGCAMPRALAWALVVAFCTLLWPYAGSSFDAALQAFWLTLAVWGVIEARTSGSLVWAVASGFSFAMLLQVQEAYVVLGACVLASIPMTQERVLARLRNPVVLIVIAGLGVGVALLFAANMIRYGDPLITGRDTSGGVPVWGSPLLGAMGLLVSPAKSIFLYSPPVILGLIGLWRLVTADADRYAPIPACLAIHLALVSSLRFWAGDWAWGPRYLVATLPLVCVGLPFAWPVGARRSIKLAVCGAGLLVQLLAISVDHQRYYFERSLPPFFWVDETKMYTDSPLFARAGEVGAVLRGRGARRAMEYVPGPRPMSMTSTVFGPTDLSTAPQWMRGYLVFLVPRPWTLWARYLPPAARPGNTPLMTALGLIVGCASFGALAVFVRRSAAVVD
ncbi:MAG TPA: hypothetical protein VH583_11270 [Vicinamibacterales bacterium]|jgi:hypothetical protein